MCRFIKYKEFLYIFVIYCYLTIGTHILGMYCIETRKNLCYSCPYEMKVPDGIVIVLKTKTGQGIAAKKKQEDQSYALSFFCVEVQVIEK